MSQYLSSHGNQPFCIKLFNSTPYHGNHLFCVEFIKSHNGKNKSLHWSHLLLLSVFSILYKDIAVEDFTPSSHEIKDHMLSILRTDLRCKQLLTSTIDTPRSQIHHHFLSALSRSGRLLAAPILVQLALYPTLTAYAAVTLHLPSDLALLFDIVSFPQKDKP